MKKVKRHHVPAAPPLRFQEELTRAERLIERGAYREALDILTALNERYPNRLRPELRAQAPRGRRRT